ncbi:MAG TPA: Rieske (2Fe-2S) protein [Jiangellaceae bacterium]|nr:Rieske (2Fe-2S) protein [Jiangellaceae bacterium]
MAADEVTVGRVLERRTVLLGAGAVGIAGVLAACGGDDDSASPDEPVDTATDDAGTDDATDEPTDATDEPDATEEPTDDADSDDDALVSASDVPVGGGVILADQGVVVTQPADGEFKGFSSTCTHQGCTVGEVSDGLIRCPCHGSRYFIEDGTVENGPATQGLPEVAVSLDGDKIVRV